MKKANVFLVLIALVVFVVSCTDEKDAKLQQLRVDAERVDVQPVSLKSKAFIDESVKSEYTLEQLETMKKLGLINSISYTDNVNQLSKTIAAKYKHYGLSFISTDALNQNLKKYNLYIGDLADYVYTIPPVNIDEVSKNLAHLKTFKSDDFEDYYFLRISRYAKKDPAKFLTKLEPIEIRDVDINAGSSLNNGQAEQDSVSALTIERNRYYIKKFNLNETQQLIVDHHIPEIKIVAPIDCFNTEGKIVDGHEIKPKSDDPAIIIRVPDGWLCLTYWK